MKLFWFSILTSWHVLHFKTWNAGVPVLASKGWKIQIAINASQFLNFSIDMKPFCEIYRFQGFEGQFKPSLTTVSWSSVVLRHASLSVCYQGTPAPFEGWLFSKRTTCNPCSAAQRSSGNLILLNIGYIYKLTQIWLSRCLLYVGK